MPSPQTGPPSRSRSHRPIIWTIVGVVIALLSIATGSTRAQAQAPLSELPPLQTVPPAKPVPSDPIPSEVPPQPAPVGANGVPAGTQPPDPVPASPVQGGAAPILDKPLLTPPANPKGSGASKRRTTPAKSVEIAPRDPLVDPAQAPTPAIGDPNPLPVAIDGKDPKAQPGAGKPPGQMPDGFVLPADRLAVGRQAVGLSIEVVAPGVMNLNHPATIKLIIRNSGTTDVSTVRVRYDLPKELNLVSSQPEAERASADDPALHWPLNTVAAGSERIITLKVKANQIGSIDHPAHAYFVVGSRARTVIQQPRLKLEMPNPTPGKVLKGQQVQFRIAVKNDGNGPARNVEIFVKFSNGLKADGSDSMGQTIPIIQPGERIELTPLIVDTFAGGEQTCKVVVSSPDVIPVPADTTASRAVFVTKPDLALKLEGPAKRFTDTLADYHIIVENPGSAPAKNVTVTAILPPSGGRLVKIPDDAEWNQTTRRLQWVLPNLDPAAKQTLSFQVRLGGMGLYQVSAEGRSGDLLDKESVSTNISGFADIKMEISERRRVMDVGELTVFDIKVTNKGTKDATNLKMSAIISKNLTATFTSGFDVDADVAINDAIGEVRFPTIERLLPGRSIEVSIQAKAKTAGVGTCRVFLEHDDLPGIKLEEFAHTTVTGTETRTK